jgi:hypothetical protein
MAVAEKIIELAQRDFRNRTALTKKWVPSGQIFGSN